MNAYTCSRKNCLNAVSTNSRYCYDCNKQDREQKQTLLNFEKAMSLGPVACAAKLDTPYTTYKAWKSGRNKMPGCAYTAIGLWLGVQDESCKQKAKRARKGK